VRQIQPDKIRDLAGEARKLQLESWTCEDIRARWRQLKAEGKDPQKDAIILHHLSRCANCRRELTK